MGWSLGPHRAGCLAWAVAGVVAMAPPASGRDERTAKPADQPAPLRGPATKAAPVLRVRPGASAGRTDPALTRADARQVAPSPSSTAPGVHSIDLPEAVDLPVAVPDLPGPSEPPQATRAAVRVEGTAAPGLRVGLDAGDSVGQDLRFLWVQTEGPAVDLGSADSPRVVFSVPTGTTELSFLLVVAGRGGIDRQQVRVPIELHRSPDLPLSIVADAGDDQSAVVGAQVTLNGIRSRPRDGVAFRWIQVDGPPLHSKLEEAWTCTFTPDQPGLYRFLLVVAGDRVISEADEVRVAVAPLSSERFATAAERMAPIERLARERATRLGGTPARITALSQGFDEAARRLDLYTAYEDAMVEIGRRIDATIAPDAGDRAEWDEQLFLPLSTQIIESLRAEGLDLATEGSEARALTDPQKTRLAEVFRAIARGLRSAPQ